MTQESSTRELSILIAFQSLMILAVPIIAFGYTLVTHASIATSPVAQAMMFVVAPIAGVLTGIVIYPRSRGGYRWIAAALSIIGVLLLATEVYLALQFAGVGVLS